jgi:iron complex transport system ATP-binding protein
MNTSLTIDNLRFWFQPGDWSLQDISLQIHPGEIVGLIGPNGSGKSTLIKLMAGLIGTKGGTVKLNDRQLGEWRRRDLAKALAYLPQDIPRQTGSATVHDIVALGRYPYLRGLGTLSTNDDAIISECLHRVGVADMLDRRFALLSGGERQRVMLASILAQEASLFLLDEPTAALDPHQQIVILGLLAQHIKDHPEHTTVIVLHDLNLAARFCHRLILLSDGAIQADGAPQDVLTTDQIEKAYHGSPRVDQHPAGDFPLITFETSVPI